ncbi:MAG: sugar transferase, partial [Candidatus Wallbacteria bacterium]|nr:sugar transferase [Candidatus Wallbacteria bacterium]
MAPVECPQSGLGLAAKRCFDLLFALPGFLLISPALLLIGLAIRCSYGSPVFFRHPRVGKGGRVFTLLKFRTMSDERGPDGALLGDHARITRLGRVIRQLSLDEFPQLLNVLKGDLSLVGPRPLLVRYWPRYTLLERARHRVLPGMTGWAQVNGRNAITWSRRFELDLW